jgi:hypothetical protein
MNRRAIPVLLWIAFLATAAMIASAVVRQGPALAVMERLATRTAPPAGPSALPIIVAYAIALGFAWKVREDYPQHMAMRHAWSLFVASCAVAVIRYGYEFIFPLVADKSSPLIGMRQIPNALTSLLLLAGLAAMWRAFSTFRMGIRLRWPHVLAIAAVLVLAPWFLTFRAGLPDGRSIYPAVRWLQSLEPVFLFASAIAAIVLHRISQEVEGGDMATSLHYIVGFVLLRGGAFAIRLSLGPLAPPVVVMLLIGLARASDWLLPLAFYYRWRVTQRSAEMADRYERGAAAG